MDFHLKILSWHIVQVLSPLFLVSLGSWVTEKDVFLQCLQLPVSENERVGKDVCVHTCRAHLRGQVTRT